MNTDNNQDFELSRVSFSTALSLPFTASPLFKTTLGNKLDHLFEITTIPEGQKIDKTDLLIMSPYHAFTKKSVSIIRSIKTLIRQLVCIVKEYVQVSYFDQHPFSCTIKEQFVTLQILPNFLCQWLAQGCTHIYFGVVRLFMLYHGRKGLFEDARLALIDTRLLEYPHACIGSLETTLNVGALIVTFYSNFNMSFQDPQLLKVQL